LDNIKLTADISPKEAFYMKKEIVILIVSVCGSIVSITATLYDKPKVASIIFCLAIIIYIAYVVYSAYKGFKGNLFVRLLPILILAVVGSLLYYFWPSTLTICLYHDENSNGMRDEGEKGIHKENVEIFDSSDVSRKLVTDERGICILKQINQGGFRIKTHDIHISGEINRGANFISIGVPPKEDKTPPEVRLFLGDEIFVHADATSHKSIYAHVWYIDLESDIEKVEIDWGEGWEKVDLSEPYMNYRLLTHQYKTTGQKRVRVRVTNKQGLTSFAADKPMRLDQDYALIMLHE
jgi:hypothetical protein